MTFTEGLIRIGSFALSKILNLKNQLGNSEKGLCKCYASTDRAEFKSRRVLLNFSFSTSVQ